MSESKATASTAEVIEVDFEENDPLNPLNWTKSYKWTLVILTSMVSLMSQLSTVIMAPATPQILRSFNTEPGVYQTLIVSIWELGEVVGPFIYGPLSEEYGRLPVIHICNGLLIVFTVGGALSVNISMLVAFRFLSGLTVASAAICPGIIGDIFVPEERGHPMSIMMLASLVGPAVGPIIGSYISQYRGWRWSLWIAAILCGAVSALLLFTYRETYKVVILKRKAQTLSKELQGAQTRTRYDSAIEESLVRKLSRAVSRPMLMLCTSPVLAVLTLQNAVSNGYMYLVFTTIAPIFQDRYHFSQGASGLTFLGPVAGLAIGTITCGYISDLLVNKMTGSGKKLVPEMRLHASAVAGLIAPLAFVLYGWTINYGVHWIVPLIASALLGISYVAIALAARMYLVDCFGIHVVSAMSALLVVRNLAATVLPLAAPSMYARLGYGWGNTVLAFVALALVPIPVLLIKYGHKLRARGKYKVIE